MDTAVFQKNNWIRAFNELMCPLNISFALGYSLLLYVSRSLQGSFIPRNDLYYYLFRSAIRVGDLLGIASSPAVTTKSVARLDFPIHRIGLELAFAVSVVCMALVIFLLLHLGRGSSWYRVITGRIAVVSALFAAPLSYLVVSARTWRWAMFPDESRGAFWLNPLIFVFAVEIISTVVFVVFRKRRLASWLRRSFFVLHYLFWIFVLWPDVGISIYPLLAPRLLLSISPLSCLAWLLYVRSKPNNSSDRKRPWAAIVAGVSGAVMLTFLWFPPPQYSVAAARNIESVSIVMSRGPCMGRCPVYQVTIFANGSVEYEGTGFVRAKGREGSTITRQQVLRILQNLDHIGFTGLEDRAFDWCFDSSSVAVQVSVDGKAKRVVSDAGCVGAKLSPQAQFVGAADNIDRIVNSNQWTLCNGRPCR